MRQPTFQPGDIVRVFNHDQKIGSSYEGKAEFVGYSVGENRYLIRFPGEGKAVSRPLVTGSGPLPKQLQDLVDVAKHAA